MILDTTMKGLVAKLGAVPTTPWTFTVEYAQPALPVGQAAQTQRITGTLAATGPTTLLASPAAAGVVEVRATEMTVYNADVVAGLLTLQWWIDVIYLTWYAVTLQPGEALCYVDGRGFSVLDANGNVKGLVPLPFGAATNPVVSSAPLSLLDGASTPLSLTPQGRLRVASVPALDLDSHVFVGSCPFTDEIAFEPDELRIL